MMNDKAFEAKMQDMEEYTHTLIAVRDLDECLSVLHNFEFQMLKISTYFEDFDYKLYKELDFHELFEKVKEYIEKVQHKADDLTENSVSDLMHKITYDIYGEKVQMYVDTEEDFKKFMERINDPRLTKTPVIVINNSTYKEDKE